MLAPQDIQAISNRFAEKTGYTFKSTHLLIQALTRKSAKGVHVPTNAPDFESLEFVGDRVLNLAVATHLRELYPNAKPSELNSYYVLFTRNSDDSKRNGGPLYRVAKELGVEALIIKSDKEDLAKYGVRGKPLNPKHKTKEGILSDHVEALLGAVYEDGGNNLQLILFAIKTYWRHMGLNEDAVSESSFGESRASAPEQDPAQNLAKQNKILIDSAKIGNLTNVKTALAHGAEITTTDGDEKSALHHFAMRGNHEAVTHLLGTLEFDVDAEDSNGITPLVYAVLRGAHKVVEELLKSGASADFEFVLEDEDVTETPLSVAARSGYTEMIVLLAKYAWNNISYEHINAAITAAESRGKANIVPALVKLKSSKAWTGLLFVSLENLLGNEGSPTGFAASKDGVKQAIANGANIYAINLQGHDVFSLLRQARVDIRLSLLPLFLEGKLKLADFDLSDMFSDVSAEHKPLTADIQNKFTEIKASVLGEADKNTVQAWLDDLSDVLSPVVGITRGLSAMTVSHTNTRVNRQWNGGGSSSATTSAAPQGSASGNRR